MEKQKVELFFIPSPLMGHAGQALELARLLVNRFHHLSITVLVMELPGDPVGTSYIHSISDDDNDRIKFIHFPPMDPDLFTEYPTVGFRVEAVIEAHRPIIRELVAGQFQGSQDQAPRLSALVVDLFCTPMIDVGKEFGVPTYVFFPSNAAFLGIILYIQTLHDEHGQDISELANSSTELMIPSYAAAVPPSVLPHHLLDKSQITRFNRYTRRYREAKGIILNTFQELETHALLSYDDNTPPVYTVGPLLKPEKPTQNSDVLQWLEGQPKSSVLLLCFGSKGYFNREQVKEIAIAVEKSEYRFIWSLRRPPTEDIKNLPGEYTDYNEVLPDGFLERTADKGKVVGWVPQTELLANMAVGGFISHCGWNSVLESLWYGVPIATWPMYAEQQLNAFQLVKELGLAVEISLDYSQLSKDQSLVSAADIEKGIREVMDTNSEVRSKVMEMKAKGRMALEEGGSSSACLRCLVDDLIS
ncbi:UDP-glycoslytransferase 3 [Artemisia annua]|uniref:Glycosyltransferase n=1 Tax=Artemisia annua TaxID=35608 RepID=A0A2U1Q8T8_ARTAN|nr:UDP-glycoslytransferase 3 [Artemisia annua]